MLTGAGASAISLSSQRTLWNMISLRLSMEKSHNVGILLNDQLEEQDQEEPNIT